MKLSRYHLDNLNSRLDAPTTAKIMRNANSEIDRLIFSILFSGFISTRVESIPDKILPF